MLARPTGSHPGRKEIRRGIAAHAHRRARLTGPAAPQTFWTHSPFGSRDAGRSSKWSYNAGGR